MTHRSRARLRVVILAVLLVACESKQAGSGISVTLSPDAVDVLATQSVQFTAAVRNSTNSEIVWSLSGAGCGGAACGTISSNGLYTAPEIVPNPAVVTVKAASAADPSKAAKATITIHPMANVWTWEAGSPTANEPGHYGTKGISALTNFPGARNLAVPWTDAAGHLWLFGGSGIDSEAWTGLLNDLWKYDPASREWVWMSGGHTVQEAGVHGQKGVPAPENVPGARGGAVSWVGSDGRFWLFGGIGFVGPNEHGELNDLWSYDPASSEWTWIAGSAVRFQPGVYGTKGVAGALNTPGARWQALAWVDPDGKLWLFGGEGYDSVGAEADLLNDLWKFDPVTLEWTWVSGSNTADQLGRYGTKGSPGAANIPGARDGAAPWIDPQGDLWLFGGWGWGAERSYIPGVLNDLWRFDRTTLEWSWVSGSDSLDQQGNYGTKGTAAASNVPGGREWSYSWIDTSGNFWIFAGYGYYADALAGGFLNDLWKYDPATGLWTWVSGSTSEGQPGDHGTQGAVALTNVPGARNSGLTWTGSGGVWIFGGHGYYAEGLDGSLNDLWWYLW
jgi:N-acetylneuraminic acid mutarotase